MTIRNLTRLCYLSVFIVGVSILWRFCSHILYGLSVVWMFLSYILYMIKAMPGEVHGAMISGIFLLVTAYLAYKYGLQTYFKQREHEQILARYLDGGIDRALSSFYVSQNAFMSNFITANQAISALEISESADPLYKVREMIPQIQFNAANRVSRLLGDITPATCLGEWWKFIQVENDFLDKEFRQFLRMAKEIPREKEDGKARAKCLENLRKVLSEIMQRYHGYVFIAEDLGKAASILERRAGLTWADVAEFRNREEVMQIVKSMKTKLQEVIEQKNLYLQMLKMFAEPL